MPTLMQTLEQTPVLVHAGGRPVTTQLADRGRGQLVQ